MEKGSERPAARAVPGAGQRPAQVTFAGAKEVRGMDVVTRCKRSRREDVREAERLYSRTGNVLAVHRWARARGLKASYNAVRRHLQEHFGLRAGRSAVFSAQEARAPAGGMIQELNLNIEALRRTLGRLENEPAAGAELRAQARAVARVTEAMARQIDLKAKMLGYYAESAEVNVILVREFREQVALVLEDASPSVRERVLRLIEEHAPRLPLGGSREQTLEEALAALPDPEDAPGRRGAGL